MSALTQSPAWKALEAHAAALENVHLRDLFAQDPDRFNLFSRTGAELFVDFSKNKMTRQTLDLLLALARQQDLEAWRERMFAGEKINTTENRAVLHTALRSREERCRYLREVSKRFRYGGAKIPPYFCH